MIEVQDMPESPNGSEPDEDAEEDAEEQEEAPEEDPSAADQPDAEMDDAAFQASMSARLEALRLHKALGNDDPADELDMDRHMYGDESESDESVSDVDSDDSDAQLSDVAPTDYTAYTRAERKPAARVNPQKLDKGNKGEKETLMAKVRAELGGAGRGAGAGAGRGKTKEGMGRQKGHKWKTSAKHIVGKDSGW